jgi:predicted double-glycine peptidase
MPSHVSAPDYSQSLFKILTALPLTILFLIEGCTALPMNTANPLFQRKYGDFAYCPVQVVKQTTHYTCGPACLTSVLRYWGVEISLRQVVEKYSKNEGRHYFLSELQSIAEGEGLKAYIFSMDKQPRNEAEQQILKGRPLICAVRLPRHLYLCDGLPILQTSYRALTWALGSRKDHFVVMFGLKPEKVLIMDPEHGFVLLSWRRFEQAWSQMKYACLLLSD